MCTGMGLHSRLVEVVNEEQMSYLESYISKVETEACDTGNYQYDYYDYYSDNDYMAAFSSLWLLLQIFPLVARWTTGRP